MTTPMTKALAAAAFLALGAAALAGPGQPSSARNLLAVPETDPPDADATGSLQVKFFPANGSRAERTWVRLRAHKLDRKADYTMWLDDPAVAGDDFVQWDAVITTHGQGNVNTRVDTKHGGSMPFGKSAQDLAGAAFQLRNVDGAVVLEGSFPTLPPPE
jgi:hypothetical protein